MGQEPKARPLPAWDRWADRVAETIRRQDRWRRLRSFDGCGPKGTLDGTVEVTSFASNDYLGLSHHPAVVAGAVEAARLWGAGAGSSRLIVGHRSLHAALESRLAEWKHAESALVFSTGFAANLGVLATLADQEVTIFSDALNHASIIDGCRLARADVQVFDHGDMAHLENLLRHRRSGRALVVSDAVFSMDGDVADLSSLMEISFRHGAMLVVDEAHAVLPWPPEVEDAMSSAVEDGRLVRVGTLSKTLGSLGGFVASNTSIAELLVNLARPFIFSTALSPPAVGAAMAALEVVASPEGKELLSRLRANIDALSPTSPSPIVPVVVGDEAAALEASARLLEDGFLVPAIRPPTVPKGTSRLRISLSSDHSPEQVGRLKSALDAMGLAP